MSNTSFQGRFSSHAQKPARSGFTLVEVMVALGIVSGAMILLLSVNRNALQRSLRSREHIRFEQVCESKLDEILSGAETSTSGQLNELAGYTWTVESESANIDKVSKLLRINFRASGPSSATYIKSVVHYGPLSGPAPSKGAIK